MSRQQAQVHILDMQHAPTSDSSSTMSEITPVLEQYSDQAPRNKGVLQIMQSCCSDRVFEQQACEDQTTTDDSTAPLGQDLEHDLIQQVLALGPHARP